MKAESPNTKQMQIWTGGMIKMIEIGVNTDYSFYSNPTTKDRHFENYFTGKFRSEIDNLPFNLYTKYKVYIKCQILYFLYLNQNQKFTINQITKPIINFVIKSKPKFAKKRKEVELFCSNAVRILAANFTILTEKYNKTKFNKYFFNPAYEQLFDYDLFWNETFIAEQLEKRQYFRISRILKFVKILDFIGNKVVSGKQIANSYLFGDFYNFEQKILQPLIRMDLVRKFKKGKYCFYCLNN